MIKKKKQCCLLLEYAFNPKSFYLKKYLSIIHHFKKMKVYQFEFENPHEERRSFPVSYLNFNHGLRCFFSAIKDDWRIGSIIEVFIANKHPRRLIFRIESRPEGDLISDFRKCPLKENREYRFNFKTLELNERRN